MTAHPIDTYRRVRERALQAGNATEPTHYPTLKGLIPSVAPGVTATNNLKQIACGAPAFGVSRKSQHGPVTLGYREAQDVGKPLEEADGKSAKNP